MSAFLKTTTIVIGTSIIFATPAQANDYELKLRWDAGQTIEENHSEATKKIETYCKAMVRGDSDYSIREKKSATLHCQDQLMSAFIKQTKKDGLIKSFVAQTHSSSASTSPVEKNADS